MGVRVWVEEEEEKKQQLSLITNLVVNIAINIETATSTTSIRSAGNCFLGPGVDKTRQWRLTASMVGNIHEN